MESLIFIGIIVFGLISFFLLILANNREQVVQSGHVKTAPNFTKGLLIAVPISMGIWVFVFLIF